MSYHLNAAAEQYCPEDDDLEGRPTIPFMRALPHLMVPLPTRDELAVNDPPAWQVASPSSEEPVSVPSNAPSEPPEPVTFIPGTNVAMSPLPGETIRGTYITPSASSVSSGPDSSPPSSSETIDEEEGTAESPKASAKDRTLRAWYIATVTVLMFEAVAVAAAKLYRAGFLTFIW